MPTNTDLVTDLPADFEVFGQAVDTSMADLKGGTTGQILSKTTNADMDFTWIANDQGDITGVTATSPLTGGGTSGAITVGIQDALTTQKGAVQLSDSTSTTSSILAATPTAVKSAFDTATTANTTANAAIPKSTVTTAGDVIYATGSSAVTRLGIGTAGQVLTVASGIPSWATPASSGGMTLLSTTTLSGASTTISLSGTYKNLQVVIGGVTFASGSNVLRIAPNGSTNLSDMAYTRSVGSSASNVGSENGYIQTFSGFLLADANNSVVLDIYNYQSTTRYKAFQFFGGFKQANPDNFSFNAGGVYKSNTAITSLVISGDIANLSSGTVLVYGVN